MTTGTFYLYRSLASLADRVYHGSFSSPLRHGILHSPSLLRENNPNYIALPVRMRFGIHLHFHLQLMTIWYYGCKPGIFGAERVSIFLTFLPWEGANVF